MCTDLKEAFVVCKLRTGVFIIGTISLVNSVWKLTDVTHEIIWDVRNHEHFLDLSKVNDWDRGMHNMPPGINLVFVATILVSIASSVLLLYGARKEKPFFLRPWIYYNILNLIFQGCAVLVLSYLAIDAKGKVEKDTLTIMLGIYIFITAVGFYFVSVVRSYFNELTNRSTKFSSTTYINGKLPRRLK